MATILDKIVQTRRGRIKTDQIDFPEKEAESRVLRMRKGGYQPAPFTALKSENEPFLIAEIKKSSPSRGVIRPDFDVQDIASAYGSSPYVKALSVLAEPDFFMGAFANIETAVKASGKPALLKDFVIDPYQIYRGYICGASAFLLIAAILDDAEIACYSSIARDLGMEILLEVHTVDEYKRALELEVSLIGINNRDLASFTVDIANTARIIEAAGKPNSVTVISESGISSPKDVAWLSKAGADGFLIGEQFMKQSDISRAVNRLMSEAAGVKVL